MSRIFLLESTEHDSEICLKLYFSVNDKKICLADKIKDDDTLKAIVNEIRSNLDKVLVQGKNIFIEFEKNKDERSRDILQDPKKMWDEIKTMEDNEMISYFNSLDLDMRKKLSSYVFSSVNMFKGKGLIFATYFNHENSLIEKD